MVLGPEISGKHALSHLFIPVIIYDVTQIARKCAG